MVEVLSNSFYRKNIISTSGAVSIKPQFTDMSVGGETKKFIYSGGTKANAFLISGNTPQPLGYGGGTLAGAQFVMYCSGVNLSNTAALPELAAYKMVSGTTISEGGMTPASGNANDWDGEDMAVYTAFCDPTLYTYYEGFDGGDSSLGNITVSAPNQSLSDPFIDLDKWGNILNKRLYAGGNYSWISSYASSIEEEFHGTEYYKNYFGVGQDGNRIPAATPPPVNPSIPEGVPMAIVRMGPAGSDTRGQVNASDEYQAIKDWTAEYNNYSAMTNSRLNLKPQDKDKPYDIWVPANDFRDGEELIHVFVPMWKFEDIKDLLEWGKISEAPTDAQGGEESVNENTTIFDSSLIFKSPGLSSYFGGGANDELPVNRSELNLSSEAYDSGGKSLQMYHLWSYSEVADDADTYYRANPSLGKNASQFSCVGMRNVPYPIPLDTGYCGPSGNNNFVFYPRKGEQDIGSSNISLPEINIKLNISEMGIVPVIGSSLASNATSEEGVFIDYISGAAGTGNPYAEKNISGTECSNYLKNFYTLQRSVCVIFSNYPPNANESLDAFIHRGMQDFYSGTTAGSKYIGGTVIFRDGDRGNTSFEGLINTSTVMAMPLQTAISNYAVSSGTGDTSYTAANRLTNFQHADGVSDACGVMTFGAKPATQQGDNPTQAAGTIYEESVPLKMGEFINMKFVFDIKGPNSCDTTNTTTSTGYHQNMARVFFTQGVATGTTSQGNNVAAQTTSDQIIQLPAEEEVIPSLPVYFPSHPTSNGTNSGVDNSVITWLAKPHLWPRYMTIWATNQRQLTDTDTSTSSLTAIDQPWTGYTSNKADFGYGADTPILTGSDQSTNVYVDTISFSNFTNTVVNASAKAVGNSQSITFKERGLTAHTANPMSAGEVAKNSAMATTPASASGSYVNGIQNDSYERFMPTYFGLGFDNGPDDLNTWKETNAGVIAELDSYANQTDASRTEGIYYIGASDYTETSTAGTGATFMVSVSGAGSYTGKATAYLLCRGKDYAVNDTFTIADAKLGGGGAANLSFDVADLVPANGIYGATFLLNGFGSQGFNTLLRQNTNTTLPFYSGMPTNNTLSGSMVFGNNSYQNFYYGQWLQNMSQMWLDYGNDATGGSTVEKWNYNMLNAPYYVGGNASMDSDLLPNEMSTSTAGASTTDYGYYQGPINTAWGNLTSGSSQGGVYGAGSVPTIGIASNPGMPPNIPWCDAITQKGCFQMQLTSGALVSWKKREHPFFSAKITHIPSYLDSDKKEINEGNAFKVDNSSIFDMPLADEYVIYKTPGIEGAPYDGTNQVLDPGGGAGWDYQYPDISSGGFGADLTTSGTFVDISTTAAANYRGDGKFLSVGKYIGVYSGSQIREILKIESYEVSGGKTTAFDRIGIARGCLNTADNTTTWASGSSTIRPIIVSAVKGIKMVKSREGNIVYMDKDVDALVNEGNLPYLYVSPYKYWVWHQIWPGGTSQADPFAGYLRQPAINGSKSSAKSYGSCVLLNELPYVDSDAATRYAKKNIDSVTTGGVKGIGSTFAESDYNYHDASIPLGVNAGEAGLVATYNNVWNLSAAESGSQLDCNKDYGFGAWDGQTRLGGYSAQTKAKQTSEFVMNMGGVVVNNTLAPNIPIISKISLLSPTLETSATFFGNEWTDASITEGLLSGTTVKADDVKPYYLWRYVDDLPAVGNFEVTPAFNLLDKATNVYELTDEDLSSVRFTWSESGDDVWYRLLMVDKRNISDKYHGFKSYTEYPSFYAPFNDVPTDVLSKPTLTFYETNTASTTTATSFNPTVGTNGRQDIEGLQGYAYKSVSTLSEVKVPSGTAKMMLNHTLYSFMLHVTPSAGSAGTIFMKGNNAADAQANGMRITQDTNGVITVYAQGIQMNSKTASPQDGLTPMNIMVVHNTGSQMPMKLYIDGKLEDYIISGTTINAFNQDKDAWFCAEDASSTEAWEGKIEEVIMWSDEIFMPSSSKEFILNTKHITDYDTSTNTPNTMKAKLFVMDYHNIRGRTASEIAATPSIAWRATTS